MSLDESTSSEPATPRNLPPARPMLLVLRGRSDVRPVRLHGDEVVIGRAPGADVRVADEGVSRAHALVSVGLDGLATIRDLGSTNGTFVDGRRLGEAPHTLRFGDRITIPAETVIKYVRADVYEEEFLAALYQHATRDPLTGLKNRFALQEDLRGELAWHQRHGATLSLVLIDLDDFKRVNDTLGHVAGDRVLQRIARIFLHACRTEDTVARLGGDEFVVVARETSPVQAGRLAERLRRTLNEVRISTGAAGEALTLTASFGIVYTSDAVPWTPESLLDRADHWMYAAKRAGKDRVASPMPARRVS